MILSERDVKLKDFIKKAKLGKASVAWLANDASGRKYARLTTPHKTYILMDSPKNEKPEEFYKIDQFLAEKGFPVPKIIQADIPNGFMIMEDFGPKKMVDCLTTHEKTITLYKKALQILLDINKISKKPAFIPDYSLPYWRFESNLLTDWYYPALTGKRLSEKALKQFQKIWAKLIKKILKMPSALTLLDYHAENIMVRPKGLGILDFQDARWGNIFYDAVSLIEDERHILPDFMQQELWDFYFSGFPKKEQKKYRALAELVAVQRHTKVIGIFARLAVRDKKGKYLKWIPDSWKLLEKHLHHPALKSYKKWLDKYIPKEVRHQPLMPKKFPYMTTAFVLAAGRGTRMRELTDNTPKPLIKVNDKTLLSYVFDKLGWMSRKVVNTCYQGHMIHEALKGQKVLFSDEKEALETGGGIQKALPLILPTGEDGFFAINADTFWLDKKNAPLSKQLLKQMEYAWNPTKMDILLALVKKSHAYGDVPKGDYFIKRKKLLRRHLPKKKAPYCFMGVQILHPDIFKGIKLHKFSLVELYDKAEKEGRLGYVIFDGKWFHVGTPEAVKYVTKYLRKHQK